MNNLDRIKITLELLGVLLQMWAIVLCAKYQDIYVLINAIVVGAFVLVTRRVINQIIKNK